jgi:glycosyltransferase involved in cell wall biosynthesis
VDLEDQGLPVDGPRIEARGKFFFTGEEKLFLDGVAYGPFAPAGHGADVPDREVVERDFALMTELGANSLRTFSVPPRWLLDLAASHGLRVLIGIPWAQHLCFLDSAALTARIRRTVGRAVAVCREHPAMCGYLIGNEIPPDIVRWYGPKRVRAFLAELARLAKEVDPAALVGYANGPSTEYLETEFTDFLAFNVHLRDAQEFRRYLPRLHSLAGNRPLVLTGFGVDSVREGAKGQAKILNAQIRAAFEGGAAGAFIFSWTDQEPDTGEDDADWARGLVDRDRQPKPAFYAAQRWYNPPLPPVLNEYPRVSVVVFAHNAERTIEECLDSLERLQYPYCEAIVVNDASTDRTPEILQSHDGIRVIHHETRRGVAESRNAGLAAATGEIVAFTGADCAVDPDWLTFLVGSFLSSGRVAVGGLTLASPGGSLVASCVAAAAGRHVPVLANDEEAEHVTGSNMAIRREALDGIRGFEPGFPAAGSDVDACWRLQDKGHTVGFSPAAVVWRHPPVTAFAYLGRQRDHGKGEALLYFEHPHRFSVLAGPAWPGNDGRLSLLASRRRPPGPSDQPGGGAVRNADRPLVSFLSDLPLSLEWNGLAILLFLWGLTQPRYLWATAFPLTLSWSCALAAALRARVDRPRVGVQGRLLIALLTYLGPLVRGVERYRWRLRGLMAAEPTASDRSRRPLPMSWRERAFSVSYWAGAGLGRDHLVKGVAELLLGRKYFVAVEQGWSEWDLEVHGGLWSKARIKVCAEHHGGDKCVFRIKCALKVSRLAVGLISACATLAIMSAAFKMPILAAGATAAAVVGGVATFREGIRLGRVLRSVLQGFAHRTRLRYAPRAQSHSLAAR